MRQQEIKKFLAEDKLPQCKTLEQLISGEQITFREKKEQVDNDSEDSADTQATPRHRTLEQYLSNKWPDYDKK